MSASIFPINTFIKGNPFKWKEGTVSSAASLIIKDIPLDASLVKFVFTDNRGTDNGRIMQMRVSSNNGASFDASSGNYSYAIRFLWESTFADGNDFSSGATQTLPSTGTSGTGANQKYTNIINFISPGNNKFTKYAASAFGLTSGGVHIFTYGGGIRKTASQVNAVQVFYNVGSISSLTYKVYLVRI